ncbi:MAG: exodeoxyribonuclease V subunit gamma [Oscillospiraceae bacterium]|jgi:ATP-dependent helicase/nuclease subunit B|nr:exodeoxyribonuclease V subunit gamma [Oscillospiraceae bacterium]
MLHLILGRAGAGKTTYVQDLLQGFARGGRHDLLLLVPEQDSFAAERAMLRLLGEQGASAVEVLSFTRLAEAVFRACGGRQAARLSDSLRAVAMSLALDAVREKLVLFRKADERFVERLLQLERELGACGAEPDGLRVAAAQFGGSSSGKKLLELSLILEAYDAILTERYGGRGDAMAELYETIGTPEGRAFFAGRVVAVDSFWGFTRQELRILGRVLEQAQSVYVTLCMDALHPLEDATGIFAHTKRTALSLLELAKQAGVSVAKPQRLSGEHKFCNFPPDIPRFASAALSALEDSFLRSSPLPFAAATQDVQLCSAEDVEAECAWAAQNIKRLLRSEGYRCREIAVLARNFAGYARPLGAALRRAGVPFFEDTRQPAANQPLMHLVRAALEIAAEGFSTEAMLRWLKTELTGAAEEETALLENYALLWRLHGDAWLRPWAMHPQGLGLSAEQSGIQAQLEVLNALRVRFTAPLAAFREKLRGCTGESGAEALYSLLAQTRVPQALKALQSALAAQGKHVEADELPRVWELLMTMLDALADLPGQQALGAKRFAALFALMLRYQTLGELPQYLDAVTAGEAGRVRLEAPRAVFLLGLNEGVFPRVPSTEGLINDADRRRLEQAGLRLQDTAPLLLDMERLLVYHSFSSAREKLCLSWARRSAAGEELLPSPAVAHLRACFPALPVQDTLLLAPMERLEGESAGFALLCELWRGGGEVCAALRAYFTEQPAWVQRLGALERAYDHDTTALCIGDAGAAEALFGRSMTLSASRAETYFSCPFRYFARYGLRAQPRREADFDPLFRGSAVHLILERLLLAEGVDALLALAPEQRRACLEREMDRYAAEFLGAQALPERVHFLFRRLREILGQVLERLLAEFSASAFRPVAYELVIDRDRPVQPLVIPLEGGGELRLRGKVDRVDCASIGGKEYFRVVDYKTGGKAFDLGDVFDGLNLQMLIYLFSLAEANAPPLPPGALPAGILYEQVRDPVLAAGERSLSDAEIQADKQKKNRADGLLLADYDVLCAMEEGAAGVYLPARAAGRELRGKLLGTAELGRLRRVTDTLLAGMAESLRRGETAALPYCEPGQDAACVHCEYGAACGREAEDPVRPGRKLNFDEALAMLGEASDR